MRNNFIDKNLFKFIINEMQEGVWVIDENECTTYVNPQMAKILKYTQEEMIGKKLFRFISSQ